VKTRYDCAKCPGYCCSYPNIPLEKEDIKELAKHFGLSKKEARKQFTKKGVAAKKGEKPPRVLRHKKDEYFGTICRFFDEENRNCGVYESRPQICRDFPGRKRCGYYDFLKFERKAQDDPDYIALTSN